MTISASRTSLFILAALLIIIGVVGAQNLFQFPYYNDAEGTNISNAWAVVEKQDFSAYTYAYEDPPAGSLLLAIWSIVSGGWNAFGFSLNTGRVLMLACHIIASALTYGIARKVSKSDLTATIATLIFAFSPLSVSLQRLVLLDNIMLVWLLIALYLILGDERQLNHYLFSSLFFGLAILTKGSAIFFLPAFIYIILLRADPYHKRFAIAMWLALVISIISLYPLYAQMRLELFPEGWILGGDFNHVSLIEALTDRGPDTGRFLNLGNGVSASLDTWIDTANPGADPIIIYGGGISAIFLLLLSIDNKQLRPVLAMLLACGLLLLWKSPVVPTDAISLLPFLALSTGLVVGAAQKLISTSMPGQVTRIAGAAVGLAVMLYPFWVFYSNRLEPYTMNQVEGQLEAVDWVSSNVPENAVVVTDNYAFLELRDSLENTHYYWKVDTDPAIKFNLLEDDQCNIDYLIVTNQVYSDIETYNLDLMRRALENSEILLSYQNNGWPVEIRQVSKVNCDHQETAQQTR